MAPSVVEAILIVSRKFQFAGSAGRASIIVDGVNQGALWSGGNMTLQLPTGDHLVEARVWWVKTHIRITLAQAKSTAFKSVGIHLVPDWC